MVLIVKHETHKTIKSLSSTDLGVWSECKRNERMASGSGGRRKRQHEAQQPLMFE